MRILLLTADKIITHTFLTASERIGDTELVPLTRTEQALERLFREPFDAMITDQFGILHPRFFERPILWPELIFLLLRNSGIRLLPKAVTHCFSSSDDPGTILRSVRSFSGGHTRRNDTDLTVSRLLQRLGTPVSLNGFDYLRDAILLILTHNCITGIHLLADIYGVIAAVYGVRMSAVEHAMRQAIDAAWGRGDAQTIESFFGDTVHSERAAPSNAAFLFRIADQIQVGLRGRTHVD